MSQTMNFHTMQNSEMPDVPDENNMLLNTENVLGQENVMEEKTFQEVKKTVEDIIEIFAVVKEDILETIVTEGTLETVPVIENDLETVTAAKDILQFVKTNECISDPLAGSEKKAVKNIEGEENSFLFQKKVWREIEDKSIFDKVSEDAIAKEATNTKDNAFSSKKDFRSLNELFIYLSEYSNKIPLKNVVDDINIHKLLAHYDEYRKVRNDNLSKLYNSRMVIHEHLEENSFITDQCRITITHIDSTADLVSLTEQELKTNYGYLMGKIKACKECLRSLGWNLDCVGNKIRHYKRLNNTVDMTRDKFLSFSFSTEKKDNHDNLQYKTAKF